MNWLLNLKNTVLPFWLMPLIIAIVLAFLTLFIFHEGELRERAKWVNKENTELVARQEKILELTTANHMLERKAIADSENLKALYEGKLEDEKNHANAVIADVRANTKRLYINTKTVQACGSGISITAAAGEKINGETRAELSGSDAQFLIAFAANADEAVIEGNYAKDKLAQCYAHVEALRAQQGD